MIKREFVAGFVKEAVSIGIPDGRIEQMVKHAFDSGILEFDSDIGGTSYSVEELEKLSSVTRNIRLSS